MLCSLSCVAELGRSIIRYPWRLSLAQETETVSFNPLSGGRTIYTASVNPLIFWRSDDTGKTWGKVNFPDSLKRASVKQIFCFPDDTSTLLLIVHQYGVFRSTDGGSTWVRTLPHGGALGEAIAYDAMKRKLYYGEYLGGPLWRSTDRGLSWHQLTRNLHPFALCTTIILEDSQRAVAVGASDGSIAKTPDEGASWITLVSSEESGRFPVEVPRLLCSATNPAHLYAVRWLSDDSTLLMSSNFGQSWSSIPVPTNKLWALEIDQRHNQHGTIWTGSSMDIMRRRVAQCSTQRTLAETGSTRGYRAADKFG